MELPKTDEGLGFNVMGGKEQNSPIYISRIIPGTKQDKIDFPATELKTKSYLSHMQILFKYR